MICEIIDQIVQEASEMAKSMWNPLAAMLDHREFEAYHVITEGDFGMPAFHTHDHYEFYLYVGGNAHITVEEKNYTPEPYALFIYPPGVMHRCSVVGELGRYERAYAYSSTDFLKAISTQDFPMLQIIEKAMEKHVYGYRLGVRAGSSLVAQMDDIIHHAHLTSPAEQMLNRCRMTMLLVSVCQAIGVTEEEKLSTSSQIHQVIAYINEHLAEDLSLDELAARFYVSKYYLLHAFKEYADISVHQYIISKRIIHAQILLRDGVSPGEAARASGFNDYAGFYRAFVKQTGTTPQKYSRKEP